MSLPNEHVKSFIKYYSKLAQAPEYALFIKGPWGCGKTHLVKECIEELKSELLTVMQN